MNSRSPTLDALRRATQPVRPDASRPGDQELANFNLREALSDITVRETSFAEFLAALRENGRHPA